MKFLSGCDRLRMVFDYRGRQNCRRDNQGYRRLAGRYGIRRGGCGKERFYHQFMPGRIANNDYFLACKIADLHREKFRRNRTFNWRAGLVLMSIYTLSLRL